MSTITIEVEIDRDTHVITYRKQAAQAHRRDVIEWKCKAGPFAIQFTGATPTGFQSKRSTRSSEADTYTLTGVVRKNAEPKVYPYGCAVYAGGKVYLDARCPVIIIDL